ncbi:MAG TPA: quinone-dependent dihydroorotate dehydrogenase [Alphaproteobacteria bacterium]|nr:quinone-dependent dihydroorotate dehydrogenase [Alphaproteobacteria bacterium]
MERMQIKPEALISFLHLLPPELAHEVTLLALKLGVTPAQQPPDDAVLKTSLWGRGFNNPIGLAAGFDKNAACIVPLLKWGFGFVEAGTVTPKAQPGNPRPRIFRVPQQRAVINRLGFNNQGLEPYVRRLQEIAGNPVRQAGIVGANVGKNKDSADAVADYVTGVKAVSPYADYVVINISSPNTPGLRGLQNKNELTTLLAEVQKARLSMSKTPPLLVKIAPDLDEQGLADVAEAALGAKVDGLIVSNTTITRPSIPPELAQESGGLSGAPLFGLSNHALRQMYRLTQGKLPIIGVGGVTNAEDAYAKIRLGASLVQLYTALVYEGPWLVARIKEGLAALLKRDGFKSIQEAVGADNR